MNAALLPPDTIVRNGKVFRKLTVEVDGKPRTIRRLVSMTREEAKKTGSDYYDHTYGWIRGGVKMEKEHPLVEAETLRQAGLLDDEDDEDD